MGASHGYHVSWVPHGCHTWVPRSALLHCHGCHVHHCTIVMVAALMGGTLNATKSYLELHQESFPPLRPAGVIMVRPKSPNSKGQAST